MSYVYGLAVTGILSILTALPAGAFWRIADAAAERGIVWLVLIAVPGNLLSALAVYMSMRAGAAVSGCGGIYAITLGVANFLVVMTLLFATKGVPETAGLSSFSAHAFTLGMAYAYYQAYKDIANDTWFDE